MKKNESFIVTLNENRDFRRIYSRGKSFVSPVLVTYVMKNKSRNIRYGITTSKKTGIAVKRNRSRRIIKEAFRKMSPNLKGGYDLVFVSRGKTPYVKSQDVLKVMNNHISKAGVFK